MLRIFFITICSVLLGSCAAGKYEHLSGNHFRVFGHGNSSKEAIEDWHKNAKSACKGAEYKANEPQIQNITAPTSSGILVGSVYVDTTSETTSPVALGTVKCK